MSLEVITNLRDDYTNSANFSDGEIFRYIRWYSQKGDDLRERAWWARLSKDKYKDMKRILAIQELREGFDSLLELIGLWNGFHIGTMRRYLVLKCHEVNSTMLEWRAMLMHLQELATYLHHIRRVWTAILGPISSRVIDSATVKNLELRAPAASKCDAAFVTRCMRDGTIFPGLIDTEKEVVLSNLLSVDLIIPSLFTFCEDTKYLEPCAKAIKILIEPRGQVSLRMYAEQLFIDSENEARQPSAWESTDTVNRPDRFEYSYRQLWMYAMRHFPDLVNTAPRKEPSKEKPIIKEPSPFLWQRFARLALKLGFSSPKIEEMSSSEELERPIRTSVPHVAGYRNDKVDGGETQASTASVPLPQSPRRDLDLQHRCGRPFETSQQQAESTMFMHLIYNHRKASDGYINAFFVQRSTFQAFFGHRYIGIGDQSMSTVEFGEDTDIMDVDNSTNTRTPTHANRGHQQSGVANSRSGLEETTSTNGDQLGSRHSFLPNTNAPQQSSLSVPPAKAKNSTPDQVPRDTLPGSVAAQYDPIEDEHSYDKDRPVRYPYSVKTSRPPSEVDRGSQNPPRDASAGVQHPPVGAPRIADDPNSLSDSFQHDLILCPSMSEGASTGSRQLEEPNLAQTCVPFDFDSSSPEMEALPSPRQGSNILQSAVSPYALPASGHSDQVATVVTGETLSTRINNGLTLRTSEIRSPSAAEFEDSFPLLDSEHSYNFAAKTPKLEEVCRLDDPKRALSATPHQVWPPGQGQDPNTGSNPDQLMNEALMPSVAPEQSSSEMGEDRIRATSPLNPILEETQVKVKTSENSTSTPKRIREILDEDRIDSQSIRQHQPRRGRSKRTNTAPKGAKNKFTSRSNGNLGKSSTESESIDRSQYETLRDSIDEGEKRQKTKRGYVATIRGKTIEEGGPRWLR